MKTYTMKANCTLLAIGIWCALGCASTSAYEYLDYEDNLMEEHLGARHF